MTVDELMKLVNAGYTKEEINALTQPAPDSAEPETEEESEQSTDAAAEAAADPTTEPEHPTTEPANNPEIENRLNGIEQNIKNLMKLFQQNNLLNDSLNTPPQETIEAATDRIMAEIIRPTSGRKE